MQRSWL